jgi:AbiV family abortive infection protein
MIELERAASDLHAFVLGAAPGIQPRPSNDEVADEMIDTAEFLESTGLDPWQLRLMATRWRLGEPSRRQYDADVAWLRRQAAIAFSHMQGETTGALVAEQVVHIDHGRTEMDNPRNRRSNEAHAAHASRRSPEYQLRVLEQRWEAATRNAGELIGDAAILADAKRLPRAFALAYFALEELAKVPPLLTAALQIGSEEAVDYRELESGLRNHQIKWETAAMGTTLSEFGIREIEVVLTEQQQEELTARRNARPLRELALYTDYRHGQVTEPSRIVDQGLVDACLSSAQHWLADVSSLVNAFRGIAASYATPAFHDQIVEAATSWQSQRRRAGS